MKKRFALIPSHVDGSPAIQFPSDVSDELRRALGTKNPADCVVVVADGEVRLDDRDGLASLLRHHGCHELSKKLKAALVPANQILVYTDSEQGTGICVLPIDELLGPSLELPKSPGSYCLIGSW